MQVKLCEQHLSVITENNFLTPSMVKAVGCPIDFHCKCILVHMFNGVLNKKIKTHTHKFK